MSLIKWRLYEAHSSYNFKDNSMRGSLRRYAIDKGITLLTDNSRDGGDVLRIALVADSETSLEHDYEKILNFLQQYGADTKLDIVKQSVYNPILTNIDKNS